MKMPKKCISILSLGVAVFLWAGFAAAQESVTLEDARAAIHEARELYHAQVGRTDSRLSEGTIDEKWAEELRERWREAEEELSKAESKLDAGDYEDAVQTAVRARQKLDRN